MTRSCIMVVDDDSAIRETLLIALGHRFNVISLPNGDDICDLVSSYIPNLLILDINLPGADGFRVCDEIRAMEAHKSLPILFSTVRRDDRSFLRGLQCGGASYITKPFEMPVLYERIDYLLKSYQTPQA